MNNDNQPKHSSWKSWLERSILEAGANLTKYPERYKRNFEARLRQQSERIQQIDKFFLRSDQKLVSVSQGDPGYLWIWFGRSAQAETVII